MKRGISLAGHGKKEIRSQTVLPLPSIQIDRFLFSFKSHNSSSGIFAPAINHQLQISSKWPYHHSAGTVV